MNANPNLTNRETRHAAEAFPKIRRRRFLVTLGAAAGSLVVGGNAMAASAVKLNQWEGSIDFAQEISPFSLRGTASHLGKFTAHGEIEFHKGEDGSLVGDGVIVFEAANGDLLAGVLSWVIDGDQEGGRIHDVSWRDSVEFSDGTVFSSTGRFAEMRPPGIVTIEYLILGTFLGLVLIARI